MKSYIKVTITDFNDKQYEKYLTIKKFIELGGELVLRYKKVEAENDVCTDKEFESIQQNVY